MKTLFISRHPGAVEWATDYCGLTNVEVFAHLNVDAVNSGDVVVGTLPPHLAAEVCAKGASFHFLQIPAGKVAFGQELSAQEMVDVGAELRQYEVKNLGELPSLKGAKVVAVTRHAATAEWLKTHLDGNAVEVVGDFDPETVNDGDVVVGTLPVHIVREIHVRGGEFYSLTLNHTSETRGKELSVEDIERMFGGLTRFVVEEITS